MIKLFETLSSEKIAEKLMQFKSQRQEAESELAGLEAAAHEATITGSKKATELDDAVLKSQRTIKRLEGAIESTSQALQEKSNAEKDAARAASIASRKKLAEDQSAKLNAAAKKFVAAYNEFQKVQSDFPYLSGSVILGEITKDHAPINLRGLPGNQIGARAINQEDIDLKLSLAMTATIQDIERNV